MNAYQNTLSYAEQQVLERETFLSAAGPLGGGPCGGASRVAALQVLDNTGKSNTRYLNTGLNTTPGGKISAGGLQIHLHWLSMTIPEGYYRALELLNEIIPGGFRNNAPWCSKGGMNYRKGEGMMAPDEELIVRLYHDPGQSTRNDAHISFTGRGCEYLEEKGVSIPDLLCKLSLLQDQKVLRATRIDIAHDGITWSDGSQVFASEVHHMILKDDYKSIRCLASRSNISLAGYRGLKQDQEGTLYFGARDSGRRLCMYNKRGFLRMELRYNHDNAYTFLFNWSREKQECGTSWEAYTTGSLRGFIDFVEPTTNPSRAKLQTWWAESIGKFERLKMVVARAFRCVSLPQALKRWRSVGARSLKEIWLALCSVMRPDEAQSYLWEDVENSCPRSDRVYVYREELEFDPHCHDSWYTYVSDTSESPPVCAAAPF